MSSDMVHYGDVTWAASQITAVYFCSEWCIVGYGTGAFWDLWIRSFGRIPWYRPWRSGLLECSSRGWLCQMGRLHEARMPAAIQQSSAATRPRIIPPGLRVERRFVRHTQPDARAEMAHCGIRVDFSSWICMKRKSVKLLFRFYDHEPWYSVGIIKLEAKHNFGEVWMSPTHGMIITTFGGDVWVRFWIVSRDAPYGINISMG